MTEKRINLCFNVDDKRQEIVYDFLMERGKKKTATVIDLVMAYLSGQSDRKNPAPNIGADIAEQVERAIKENSNRTETEKIQRSLDKILTLLESGVIINSSQGDEKIEPENEQDSLADSEMSDDAFSAMVSIFGA